MWDLDSLCPVYVTHFVTSSLTSFILLVPQGGMALGAYITLFASRRQLAAFRKLIVAHEADETIVADDDFMAKIYRDLGSKFHGFMVTQAHSAGLRKQRFFVTFMARYHGLSILGSDIICGMGMIMPSTNYDRMLKEVVQEAKDQARYSVVEVGG